jgi:hypothetical protein
MNKRVSARIRWFGILGVVLLLSACVQQRITLERIMAAAQLVQHGLKLMQMLSGETTTSVTEGYTDLGQFLKDQKLSNARIIDMEKRHTDMQKKADRFSQALSETESNANTLFTLLEKRSKEAPEQVQDGLLTDVAQKKSAFTLKLSLARAALLKLDKSIKRYDEILAYLQVSAGKDGVDKYMRDIDDTVAQSTALNQQIQIAVRDGMVLVDQSEQRPQPVADEPPKVHPASAPPPVAPASAPVPAQPQVRPVPPPQSRPDSVPAQIPRSLPAQQPSQPARPKTPPEAPLTWRQRVEKS